MLHASTQQLIRKLCELTDTGAINWKEGKGQISVLETEGYVVEIQPDPPSVRLLRDDGQELERAEAADLAAPWGDNEGTFADHVGDMARRANRFARGAETAIAKILSSLSAPPKKLVEPEPEPAALAFADIVRKPASSVQASESAAAIAAVSADLESQRRKAAEDPPVSHSVAEAPALIIAPETETAIDRVLAVQPPVVVTPEPPKEDPKPEPPKPVAVAQPPTSPVAATPRPAPVLPDPILPAAVLPPPVQTAPTQPAPAPIKPAPAAQPVMQAPPQPVVTPPAPVQPTIIPPAATQPAPAAQAGFGAIDGFARSRPAAPTPAPQPTPQPPPQAERKPQPAAPASSGLLMRGFSVQSRQTVEPSTANDFYRPPAASTAPAPQPPQPAPAKPEPKPEPVKPAGKDVYKPWG